MKDRHSTTSQLDLTRRDMLKGLAATGALAITGTLGLSRVAAAADSQAVSAYGVTTAQLKDWSVLQKSTGLKMQYVGSNNDVGVFMRDILASQMGNKVDIFIFEVAHRTSSGRRVHISSSMRRIRTSSFGSARLMYGNARRLSLARMASSMGYPLSATLTASATSQTSSE
jgi:hypothetical protein